jgi:hypothetical protein
VLPLIATIDRSSRCEVESGLNRIAVIGSTDRFPTAGRGPAGRGPRDAI